MRREGERKWQRGRKEKGNRCGDEINGSCQQRMERIVTGCRQERVPVLQEVQILPF